jgi:DNA-binding MarR family transcriptional regulator
MESHAQLWGEFAALLRGMKEINAHSIEITGARCEQAGAAVLGRLDLLGPVRLTDLAHALGLDPSSVSRQVTALERLGWVAREKDPSDLRAQRLHLTERGTGVVSDLRQARAEALAQLTPHWTTAELDDLTDRLARLNHDLEAHRELLAARLETV